MKTLKERQIAEKTSQKRSCTGAVYVEYLFVLLVIMIAGFAAVGFLGTTTCDSFDKPKLKDAFDLP